MSIGQKLPAATLTRIIGDTRDDDGKHSFTDSPDGLEVEPVTVHLVSNSWRQPLRNIRRYLQVAVIVHIPGAKSDHAFDVASLDAFFATSWDMPEHICEVLNRS